MKGRQTKSFLPLTLCSVFTTFLFSTAFAIAGPDKPFYVVPGFTLLAEEDENVNSFIQTTVSLRADPALVSSGRVSFPGIKIPVISAALDFDDLDGASVLLGWRFTEHFALEMLLTETRNLEVSFDLPAQTIDLANSFNNSTLEGIGNADPGNISVPSILGRLANFEILELALGSNYRFSVHDAYQLYLGVGIIGFKEIDTIINPLSGLNTDNIEADFDSDLDFYFQAGFDYQITDRVSLLLDIKQVSSDSTISFRNIQLAADNPATTVAAGDLKTEFKISGNLYHLGLRYIF